MSIEVKRHDIIKDGITGNLKHIVIGLDFVSSTSNKRTHTDITILANELSANPTKAEIIAKVKEKLITVQPEESDTLLERLKRQANPDIIVIMKEGELNSFVGSSFDL